jgi:hypothetical protein
MYDGGGTCIVHEPANGVNPAFAGMTAGTMQAQTSPMQTSS